MSWEHAIARELKKRDNPVYYAWFSGEVTSPVQTTDEGGPRELLRADDCLFASTGQSNSGQTGSSRSPGPSLTTLDSGLPCWGIPLPKSRAVRKF